jgi:hypothetical protein
VSNTDAIIGAAGAIGSLIKLVADLLGEPLEDVRKRVLAQVAADAADPHDETDAAAAAIDADLPNSER